eukprot:scaffold32301_cov30-Phaeocystis_antarctica.AAC.1
MPAHACICSRCAPPPCHPPNVLAHGTDCTPCECTEAVGTLVMTSGGFHDLVGVRGSHTAAQTLAGAPAGPQHAPLRAS